MQKFNFKDALPYILSILFFALLSFLYFTPDVVEGRVLFQSDMSSGLAIGHESSEFLKESGERTRWTNSLFSGMPSYQIAPSYDSDTIISTIAKVYSLFLPTPLSYIFILLVGFFILLLSLRVKWYVALWGAVAYAFSSYFFIIIGAGHIWKVYALAYIPPTIAGVILAYNGRYLYGAALAAFFAMLQLYANHVQMTYYSLFVIFALVVAYFVDSYRNKQLPHFFKASGALFVAAILAVASLLPNLYNTYDYSRETMRGKAPLVLTEQSSTAKDAGLTTEYITQWSYGIGETWSLLVPNVKGGASGVLSANADAMQTVPPEMRQVMSQVNHYWGDQPFTSGPVYVGALVLFFFILGCFIVKGPLKWALLVATLLTVMLSWGKNFLPLTQLFIDVLPMYNKFRAVSSILVVAEFTIPLLAVLALKQIIEQPEKLLKEQRVQLGISAALTAGVALLFAFVPTLFFDFLSLQELSMLQSNPNIAPIFSAVSTAREAIFTTDSWRSFIVVTIGVIALYLFAINKINKYLLVGIVGVVTLADLYTVNKRYLNSDNFVAKQEVANPFPMTQADQEILKDTDPNYRVLNLTVDTYNDPTTSYYHKSIGGYHAAKLRSYQDLIDHQLSKRNPAVLNMLNTKYFIVPGEGNKPQAMRNTEAAGNAWFVSEIKWVDTPAAEMQALDDFDPRQTAVVNRVYEPMLAGKSITPASGDTIYLTSYKPNELTYKASSQEGGVAVFSEIYYPKGWSVTIDGAPVEVFCADYLLRALYIPAGNHEITFLFDPTSVHTTVTVAYIAIALIILLMLAAFVFKIKGKDSL